MTRDELAEYIVNNYSAEPDYPWIRYPSNEVFRHMGNKKWFALIMDVQRDKLGLPGEGVIDIVNFKCEPVLISVLTEERGFFPAYHMNKKNWITAALDGSADDEKIKMLLDMSYNATAPKIRGKR
ncbi:MAG: MmcQ/YjbR family DNA-binding protein [Oscillospiraceae bacterium]|nr:MmcQ/YjbR family DNA-binding protein [Oscillospiraceae bacterium]